MHPINYSLKIVFIVLAILLYSPTYCIVAANNQDQRATGNKLFIEASYHFGSMYPHHSYLQFYNEDYINGFELKAWKHFPNLRPTRPPGIGVGIYHSNLGNRNIYGHNTGVYLSFLSSYFSIKEIFSFSSTVSSGISYASKPFDKEQNPLNQAIGTHLNALIVLSLNFNFQLNSDFSVFVSPSLSHTSNGRIKFPNTGLNLYTIQFGGKYKINGLNAPTLNEPFVKNPKINIVVMYAGGIRQSYKRNPFKEYVSSSIVEVTYSLNPNHRIGIGGNLFQSKSLTDNLSIIQENVADFTPTSGLHFTYEIVWGKLSFTLHPGLMVTMNTITPSKYFTRVGIRYNFFKGLFLNCSLKSAQFSAEYIEWGIGYNLNLLSK
jgi:hypothetical protein